MTRNRGLPDMPETRSRWQIDQAATCGCRGSDDYCPCQNVDRSTTRPVQLSERERALEALVQKFAAVCDQEVRFGDDDRSKLAVRVDLLREAAALTDKAPSAPAGEGETVEELWTELCERDDRTSGEDYPDMCLITFDELADFCLRSRTSSPEAPADLTRQAGHVRKSPKNEHDADALEGAVIEALKWYGEQARLARLIHSEGDAGRHALAGDGGKRAAEALSTLKAGA